MDTFITALHFCLVCFIGSIEQSTSTKNDNEGQCHGVDERLYAINEIFSNGVFWFTCTAAAGESEQSAAPLLKRSGCVDIDGNYIPNGQRFRMQYYTFICEVGRNGVILRRPVACLKPDGSEVGSDETYVEQGVMYKCILPNVNAMHKALGCVAPDGVMVPMAETYAFGNLMYECQQLENGGLKLRVAGCASENGYLMGHGCTWLQYQQSPLSFRYYCRRDENETYTVEIHSCKYTSNDDTVEIRTGCYSQLSNGEFFTCRLSTRTTTAFIGFTQNKAEIADLSSDPKTCAVKHKADEEC